MTSQVKDMLCEAYIEHTKRAEYLNFLIKIIVFIMSLSLLLTLSTIFSRDAHLLVIYVSFAVVSALIYAVTVYRREKELDRLIEITIEKIRNAEIPS